MLFSFLQNRRKSKEEEGNKIEKKKENETEELLSSCVYNKVLWLSACFKQVRRVTIWNVCNVNIKTGNHIWTQQRQLNAINLICMSFPIT
ncbi:hypothetical protein T06_5572 [Trichinella sp. T6]|nr:hypothetical protein T06_5572 [Trichinella sp. T6]